MPESRIPRVPETSRTVVLPPNPTSPFSPWGTNINSHKFPFNGYVYIPVPLPEDCLPFNPRVCKERYSFLLPTYGFKAEKWEPGGEQRRSGDERFWNSHHFFNGTKGHICMNFYKSSVIFCEILSDRERDNTRYMFLLRKLLKGGNGLSLRDFFAARNRLLR